MSQFQKDDKPLTDEEVDVVFEEILDVAADGAQMKFNENTGGFSVEPLHILVNEDQKERPGYWADVKARADHLRKTWPPWKRGAEE